MKEMISRFLFRMTWQSKPQFTGTVSICIRQAEFKYASEEVDQADAMRLRSPPKGNTSNGWCTGSHTGQVVFRSSQIFLMLTLHTVSNRTRRKLHLSIFSE